MVNAIQFRKRSPLGSQRWQQSIWTSHYDIEQSLLDCGFELAGVLEDHEGLSTVKDRNHLHSGALHCLSVLFHARQNLMKWYARLRVEALLPAPWSQIEVSYDEQPVEDHQLLLDDHRIAIDLFTQYRMMQRFWTFLLICKIVMTSLYAQDPTCRPSQDDRFQHDSQAQLHTVRNIICLTKFITQDKHWTKPAAASILPVRMALYAARTTNGLGASELAAECVNLLESFSGTAKIAHAKAILHNAGTWQEKEAEPLKRS